MYDIERSRENEESRIVGNWFQRLRRCLLSHEKPAFGKALKRAAIGIDELEERQNLTLPKLDSVLLVMHKQVPDILFRLYKQASILDLEVLGYAAMSSKTVGRAFEVLKQFHELTSGLYDLMVELDDKEMFVFPVPRPGFESNRRYIAEDSLAGIWNFLQTIIEQEELLAKCRVAFDYAAPDTQEQYEAYFNCPIAFDAPRTGIYIPVEIANMSIDSANQAMADACSAICDRIIPRTRTREDLRRSLQRLLLSRPVDKMLKLKEAAHQLSLTEAQLRKGLYRLGTSYRKVLLEVRMSLAKHYLAETRLNMDEIAYLLDYSYVGGFSRAFKNEFGYPPIDFRRSSQLSQI